MQYRLDNSKTQTFQISNDAAYYLMYGDEPLDEDNLDEAKEIEAMFPHGYSVSSWELVEGDEGLIEIVLVPYVQDDIKYDGQVDFVAKNWVLRYKYINSDFAHINIYNNQTGEVHMDFDCRVIRTKNSKYPWIVFNSDGDASHLSNWNNCTQFPLK